MRKTYSIHAKTKNRKKMIMESALACFTKIGFNETTMADICEDSRASVGSLYHHFKSKDNLAAAIYLEGIKDYQSCLLGKIENEHDACRGISGIIGAHLTWVDENPDWARFLFHQRHSQFLLGTDREISALNRNFAVAITAWLTSQVEKGAIKKLSWDVVIPILLGPCQEYSRLYLSGKSVSNIQNAIKALSGAAWEALKKDK